MRRTLLISTVVVAGLIALSAIRAQGILRVSNQEQAATGSMDIGSDSWLAQNFGTGTNPNGYILNSVQILMGAPSGNPTSFSVHLYARSGNDPGTSLGSLTGPEPTNGGILTYTTPGIVLSPSTLYFVVATAASPVAQGAYNWSASAGPSGLSSDGWGINGWYTHSSDGLSWQMSRQYTFQMAVYASVVPEPSAWALFCIGGGALMGVLRRGK